MEKKTYVKKLALWTLIGGYVLALILGLCFGRVIEGSLFAEISKWFVVSTGVIAILEGFLYAGVGGVLYHFIHERKMEKKENEKTDTVDKA